MKSAMCATRYASSFVSDLCTLVKARLSSLVIFSVLAGFLVARRGEIHFFLLGALLVGSTFSAFGSAALNQWRERGFDALMKRTKHRPLPAGRMLPEVALGIGIGFIALGLAVLLIFVNGRSAFFSALTISLYLFVYTPMKRYSSVNTLIGAIPGALPPLIGWVAAGRALTLEAGVLFAILFLWQMPHVYAIGWMYRKDYAAAGYRMLSRKDAQGVASGRWSVLYTAILLGVSLLPAFLHEANLFYFIGALLAGCGFLYFALRFACRRSDRNARQLFFASLIYLPVVLSLLVFARSVGF